MSRNAITRLGTACLALLGGLAFSFFPGCRSGESYRNSVPFHAQAVRTSIEALKKRLPIQPRDGKLLQMATEWVEQNLRTLPGRVDKEQPPEAARRKQAAEKAYKLFTAIQPTINSCQYDEVKMQKSLDEILKIVMDEVESGT